ICAHIFRLKLKALLKDIIKNSIFGKTPAYIYVIESQKCGFLYAYILIILLPDCKPRITEDYDHIISAKIPDPYNLPHEYATIIQYMMHRPCRNYNMHASCMQDGKYLKGYPKPFQAVTSQNEDAWFDANCDQNICKIAKSLTYTQFPHKFVFNNHTKKWNQHISGHTISRMYFVHLGADVYQALGLLQNDLEWDQCLKEVSEIKLGSQLRQLFATILLNCYLTHPEQLWIKYKHNLKIELCALHKLEDILMQQGKSLKDFSNMPIPTTVYAAAQSEFANWLLQVGERLIPEVQPDSSFIRLPSDIIIKSENIQDLIEFVYPNLQANICNSTYFTEGGILASLNDD
ncbi:5461_t:CDS:2, partial [Racocetra persica]